MGAVCGRQLVYVGLVLFGCCSLLSVTIPCNANAEYALQATFGPDGSEATAFQGAGSIAIDQQSENVYVIDRGAGSLFKFDTDHNPVDFAGSAPYISGNKISGLSFFPLAGESQLAVDSSSHTVYVTSGNALRAFSADGEPSVFTAGPAAGSSEITGFTTLIGVATDATGAIYASDFGPDGNGFITVFAPSGEVITQFSTPTPANVAVDGNGAVYVVRWHSTVLKFTPSNFPVTASTTYTAAPEALNASETYTVGVDPSTNDVYVAQGFADPKIVVYDGGGAALGSFGGAGEDGQLFRAEGVAVDVDSARIFVGNVPLSGASLVEVFGIKPPPPPAPPILESLSASTVAADSATLSARINPNSDVGATYRFEYGLTDCSMGSCISLPAGGASIGPGHEGVMVSQGVAGLQASTTYHFRLVAENGIGTTEAPDRTFTTQGLVGGFRLGDLRVWEMVSPPNKHGALLMGSAGGHIQAAAAGDRLTYLSGGSIEVEPEGNRVGELSNVLAQRGDSGWHSLDITPPNSRVVPMSLGFKGEYKLFTKDLSEALLEPRDGMGLSQEASERTPYLRENTEPPQYRPLVTGKEGYANVPPGTVFGGAANAPRSSVVAKGATPDLDHVALVSSVPLVAGAATPSLYRWTAGDLQVVSVLPAAEGGEMVESDTLGSGSKSVRYGISADGSRIYWTAKDSGKLYLRDMVAEETARIDVVQPGASGAGEITPEFQGASADGSVVLFTDTQQLTEDASPSGSDLYRCELSAEDAIDDCSDLVDITPPEEGSGESAEVLGVVPGMNEEGTMAYFVARGALDGGVNQNGQGPAPGEPNLYLWQEDQGLRFIATLAEGDSANWGMPGGVPGYASAVSAVSAPSGQFFAFMSQRSLTGEDNRDAVTGDPVERVFRFDAESNDLLCVSCLSTGAASTGMMVDEGDRLIDPQAQWLGKRVAAVLPQPTVIEASGNSLYRARGVLDNGRVFFNSLDPLVAGDSNDQWDVYEYEDFGSGDCGVSVSNAVSRSGAGCVSLMSSGTASREAGFLDASVSGDDVFFLTPARLSVDDKDSELDVYDARVGGRAAVLGSTIECFGESCRPAVPPSPDPAIGSAGFTGAGNAEPGKKCPKGKRKVRRKGKKVCIPRKHGRLHRRAEGQKGRRR